MTSAAKRVRSNDTGGSATPTAEDPGNIHNEGSQPPAKKAKTAAGKTGKNKRGQKQQLISRFFTATPVRSGKKPETSREEGDDGDGGKEDVKSKRKFDGDGSEHVSATTPSPSVSTPQVKVQVEKSAATKENVNANASAKTTKRRAIVQESSDQEEPDEENCETPTVVTGGKNRTRTGGSEGKPSSQSQSQDTALAPAMKGAESDGSGSEAEADSDEDDDEVPVMRRRTRAAARAEPRVTHRVTLDLGSDDDEEEEFARKKKVSTGGEHTGESNEVDEEEEEVVTKKRGNRASTTDADFVVDDDHEETDESDEGEDEDVDAEMCDDEDVEKSPRKKKAGKEGKVSNSEDRVTLSSYALNRHDPQTEVELPRDEKRRKKLTEKVGRMEANNWFRRARTDGDDGDGDAKEEDGKGQKKGGKNNKKAKYTPLETQYVSLRDKHPGLVLVVECGYKYRLFDGDAAVASKVLRVASYMDHNFLTASFPTHRLAHHVRRLVDAGHKVGVVAQAETAALKKAGDTASKLFQRTLSAVYSKGTIVADGTLAGASAQHAGRAPASFIMAVCEVLANSADGLEEEKKTKERLVEDRIGVAVAAVDCATGEVLFDTFVDDVLRSELDARLVSIEPVELLTVGSKSLSKRTNTVLRGYIETSSARHEVVDEKAFVKAEELHTLNDAVMKSLNNSSTNQGALCQGILQCIGVLFSYLKQFSLDLTMKSVTEYKLYRSRRHMKVGADVMRNFEVFGNSNTGSAEGSLIALVNRTSTAFGSRQMRFWLSHPLVDPRDISDRLQAVAYLRDVIDYSPSSSRQPNRATGHASESTQGDVGTAMSHLVQSLRGVPDLEQGLTRITCGKSSPEQLVAVLQAVENVGRKTDHLKSLTPGPEFPDLLKKLLEYVPHSDAVLENPIVRILNQRAVEKDQRHLLFDRSEDDGEPDDDLAAALHGMEEAAQFMRCVKEVSEASSELKASLKAMDKLLKRLREKHSHPSWEWKKVAQDEFLLEVPTNNASRMPKSWTIISQTKAVKRFRPQEAVGGYDRVLRAREVVQATSTQCWASYLKLFGSVASKLRGLVRALMDIDCFAALAQVSQMPGYCQPTIDFSPGRAGIRAVDARHALSELLPSCTSYIPNNVKLGSVVVSLERKAKDENKEAGVDSTHDTKESTRAVVISGPNYGGKSSYTRMTALLILLAQIGSFVPAQEMCIRPFDAIYARMGASDNLAKGLSSLMVELAETSRILSAATSRSLVVMDELGRGTSTHDGSAIAYATLDHLVSKVRCVTLFVTHYPMVASLTGVHPGAVEACYMDYREEDDKNVDNITGEREDEIGRNETKEVAQLKREKKKKITLLYKLTQGVASSSYGINVARLAGLPSPILNNALEQAARFELGMKRTRRDERNARLLRADLWKADEDIRKALLSKHSPSS